MAENSPRFDAGHGGDEFIDNPTYRKGLLTEVFSYIMMLYEY